MYTELADYGLIWAVWLAWAGVAVIAALSLMLMIKNPNVAAFVRRTLLRGPRLSGRLMIGFSLIGIVPVLTLAAFLAVDAASALLQEQVAQLEGQAATVANSVTPLIEQKVSGIDALAGHVSAQGMLSETALRDWLLRHHQVNQEFVSMWVARPDGQVIVATAATDGKVEPWRGPQGGVALMESFQHAVEQGTLYVSPIRKGLAPTFMPMIVISVPVFGDADAPRGFLQALLNLRDLVGGIVDASSSSGIHAVIVNAANQVVLASSGLDHRQFESLDDHPIGAATGNSGGFGFSGTIEVTGESGSYVVVERPLDNGWRVFVMASRAGVLGLVMMHFGFALVWVPVVVLLARGLAGLYGGAIAEPLKQLDESLDVFDVGRTISVIPPAPQHTSEEVRQVYARVGELMRKSRDAYRNMLRAVTEGTELRQELQHVVGGRENGVEEGSMSDLPLSDGSTPNARATYFGRVDPVTELAGQELFEEFFHNAWTLGVTDGRPVSLLLIRIANCDEVTLKSVAKSLSGSVSRMLDLVARTGADQFSMLLPDTELKGARAVAERTLKLVQSATPAVANRQALATNLAVVSIVPTADGNPRSFIDLAGRVLQAARKKGNGKIAYISSEGKIKLLTPGDSIERDEGR